MLRYVSLGQKALRNPVHWVRRQQANAVSSGRREFFQRLNEQHLAHELKNLSLSAQGLSPDPAPFNPKIKFKPHRRPSPVLRSEVDEAPSQASRGLKGGNFIPSPKTKPWLHYESMRGEAYPSSGSRPKWQDLTHAEAQRMQEMYMRKQMLNRKFLWMKTQHLPNPQKDAKMEMRRRENDEQKMGNDMYPLPFLEKDHSERKWAELTSSSQREEFESRLRSRIRQQKLENAKVIKANIPNVGRFITDPIQRHVQRRLLRQRTKIHAGLEEALTRNSAQILYEFLRGVAVSIVRVRAKRPRQTQEIIYNLTSDHDPAWVQKKLDVLAPKLRSQLALSKNMGQTPNIRFVAQEPLQNTRRSRLWKFAKQIQDEIPAGSNAGVAFAGGEFVPPKRRAEARSQE